MASFAAQHRRRASAKYLIVFALAFRNIFRNRMRTGLTLGALICGVAAIIVAGGFVEDVFVQLREATIHSQLGHLQIYRKGYLEYGRREPNRYLIEDPRSVTRAVGTSPHVQAVMTRAALFGLASNGRADLPVVTEGIEPEGEARLGSATVFVAGHALGVADSFGAVVGQGVANALKLRVGESITLTTSTPGGALNAQEFAIVGIFRTFSKDYDDRAVRIPLAAAQELLNSPAVHSAVVVLDDTANTEVVLQTLRRSLETSGYEVKPWYELADFYAKTVALYRRQFGALQLIILILLVLSVASTINMVVYERTGEFGTLLALGSKRRSLLALVLLENSLLGAVGALLGVLVGIGAALLITSIGIEMPPPPGSTTGYTASIRLVPSILIGAAVTGALSAIIAAWLPARRASRLAVVDALRFNV